MRRPNESIEIFKQRRSQVLKKLGSSTLIVASHPEHIRNNSVHFPYRQDSNLYYLTGFEEPESVLVLRQGAFPESVLFVRKKNVERETWDGYRYGVESAQDIFQVDKTYPIDDFESALPSLLKGSDSIYYRLLKSTEFDAKILNALNTLRTLSPRSGFGLLSIYDADVFLGEFRLRKSDAEMHNQRRACQISAHAHRLAMQSVKPGMNERHIQGIMTQYYFAQDCAREGYNPIVASGNNATTLHYNFNDQKCKDGDLLLIDSGAEYNFYTGDISRTFPVNGIFTNTQAKLYQAILDVQKEIISSLTPGLSFKDLHDKGASLLMDVMLDFGFFSGRKDDLMASHTHRKYYPHGIGHWLGMDVHDAGLYFINGQPRTIEQGMCFTIEPGIYVPESDIQVPKEFRGIGIRIEDNIHITSNGYEVLTSDAPKEIEDIQNLMNG